MYNTNVCILLDEMLSSLEMTEGEVFHSIVINRKKRGEWPSFSSQGSNYEYLRRKPFSIFIVHIINCNVARVPWMQTGQVLIFGYWSQLLKFIKMLMSKTVRCIKITIWTEVLSPLRVYVPPFFILEVKKRKREVYKEMLLLVRLFWIYFTLKYVMI